MAETLRAAVVGSGFGGLALAIRLQAAGVQTTIFEARDQAGGRAAVHRDAGFVFDAGPTVITYPACLEELFALAGRRLEDEVELLPVHPFYRLRWSDGDAFDYDDDFEQRVRERSPGDVAGYARFLTHSRAVYAAGFEALGATPFLHFWDMVRAAPQLTRLRADRSVYQTVARFVRDEKLRQALSFHSLLVGGNPFDTSSIYTLIHYLERRWGVYFPRGGTGALVRALVRLFGDLGGELRLGAPVRRIVPEGGRAPRHRVHAGEAGGEIFDLVVSNADVHHTYDRLLAGDRRAAPMRERLERMDWSMSLFIVYFGARRRWPNLAHHTVLFGPRYRGLLDDIFHGHALPEDFSLYLHAPTVSDPSLAPPECTGFYVLSPVPHLGHLPVDWERVGPAYAERILGYLEAQCLPGLRASLVTQRFYTPRDFERELGAYHGSAFSVAPRLVQSAYFRPHNRDPRIPRLYLVGAGTHPGAGIPGVVSSAKATARAIAADLNLPALAHPPRLAPSWSHGAMPQSWSGEAALVD